MVATAGNNQLGKQSTGNCGSGGGATMAVNGPSTQWLRLEPTVDVVSSSSPCFSVSSFPDGVRPLRRASMKVSSSLDLARASKRFIDLAPDWAVGLVGGLVGVAAFLELTGRKPWLVRSGDAVAA